jgi:hypothetical protein
MIPSVVAVLLWAAAGYRGLVLYSRRELVTWAYLIASAAVAAAYTAKLVEGTIDYLSPYVGDLVKHLLIVVSCAGVQVLVLGLRTAADSKPSVTKPVLWASTVGAAMIVTFALAPIHAAQHRFGDLDADHGQLLWVGLNRVVFVGYLSYVLLSNARLYTRNTSAPSLVSTGYSGESRAGGTAAHLEGPPDVGAAVSLRLIGWGSLIGLGYTGSRLIYVVAAVVFHRDLTGLDAAGSVIAVICGAFLAAGMVAPRFVPWLLQGINAWRKLPQLYPLWAHLIVTFPGIKVATKFPLTPGRADFRFQRRLAEIEHGLHGCRLPVGTTTATDSPDSPDTAIRAVALELAKHRSTWTNDSGPTARQLMPQTSQGRELSVAAIHLEQVEHLVQLAGLYRQELAKQSAPPALKQGIEATP